MSTTTQSRCLYCSLACPVAIEQHGHGVVKPTFAEDNGGIAGGRLCYRGHYVAGLLSHAKRLTRGGGRDRPAANQEMHEAIVSDAARAIKQGASDNSLGVMISGNLPTEQIAAAGRFFKSTVAARHVSVFIPPTDAAMLAGINPEAVTMAQAEDLDTADVALAVGDVLGTHPVLGRKLLDIRERSRTTAVINVDSIKGRTMRFATQGLQVACGSEAAAVLALCSLAGVNLAEIMDAPPSVEQLLATSGVSKTEAQLSVDTLRRAHNGVVMLSMAAGRCRQCELVAAATAALAVATKAKLLPLYALAGSPGAYAVSQSLGLTTMADWLTAGQAGELQTVFLAEANLVDQVPDALLDKVLGSVKCLIVASAMPNGTTERADITLPLAFGLEMGGSILDHRGQAVEVPALREAPGAAASLVDLLNNLAGQLGAGAVSPADMDLSGIKLQGGGKKLRLSATGAGGGDNGSLCLTARTETVDLCDGGLSSQLDWPGTIEPMPAVVINPTDAKRLGVSERGSVSVTAGRGSCELSVRINGAAPAGVAAVSAANPETKNLFDWQLADGAIEVQPLEVQMRAL